MVIRSCAATLCRERVNPGHMMCGDHWLSLPFPLRLAILEYFRAGWREPYQDAVREAVDLIDTREFTPTFPDAHALIDGEIVQYQGRLVA